MCVYYYMYVLTPDCSNFGAAVHLRLHATDLDRGSGVPPVVGPELLQEAPILKMMSLILFAQLLCCMGGGGGWGGFAGKASK